MAQNISKYISLTDFILLEYEFSRDNVELDLTNVGVNPVIAHTNLGTTQYFNKPGIGWTNNTLELNSVPTNAKRTNWYINPTNTNSYYPYFDSSVNISQTSYPHDIVKLHIVSGYNFDDIAGFLLQIRAKDSSGNYVDMSNFTWIKQIQGSQVIKFSKEPIYLGNRFYDKYTELKIPSIQSLGGDALTALGQALNIEILSDVYFNYSTIVTIDTNNEYLISDQLTLQLPVTSNADNFNCFIAESTVGDYIEYYATWNNIIIGEYMSDIESGRIPLYTSNNPNDNYQEFTDLYGTESAKWVITHEIQVYEQIPPSTSLLTQRFQFTQENNFNTTNKFRPIIINSDIAVSYTIDYICKLTNRMDGSQIIRKASFSSVDPKKYGKKFNRINVDNYIPYKVFNKIIGEKANIIQGTGIQRNKFTKIFYDTTFVMLNTNNEVLPQGTGPLFLKKGDSTYKFKFERLNQNIGIGQRENVDLSGVFNYALLFVLDDDTKIEISPTFSTNMNTTLGELEFKIQSEHINTLLKQTNNSYSIVIKNPDGTQYSFYEGLYFSYNNFNQVASQYKSLFDVSSLNTKIAALEAKNKALEDENIILKSNQ
jgi:hypothetical protein